MKIKIAILFIGIYLLSACEDLNLNPLSEGSSENWYKNETEITMALNDLYRGFMWTPDDDQWTDDWTARNSTTPVTGGTITGEWGEVEDLWLNSYKAIARANTLIQNLNDNSDLSENKRNSFIAEARFVRASQYARLISHFGDVVFYEENPDLNLAFDMARTSKDIVLDAVYEDYDFAAQHLKQEYGDSETKRATSGAALAMKARIALYNGDWAIARDASKACMDLGVYELYPDFEELFYSSTVNPDEVIFAIPRSSELDVVFEGSPVKWLLTRNAGGFASRQPSWDLFCSFLCTDGLPIDESPLFEPREPFKNRDPRCSQSIVEFQTPHLGFIYEPHPDSLQVLNVKTGQYQKNNDTRTNAQFASYNGLMWKKGIDDSWSDDYRVDVDIFIMRYADVLLMYAESKIELNEIDQTVLDAMNRVRARAYGVNIAQTDAYPEIVSTDQAELRKILRNERRMEFAWEGLRYMDIIRWRLAEKVLNNNIYGMLDPNELKEKVTSQGLWFFPETPPIDEDGVADFTSMYNNGLIKQLAVRNFDPQKQYLFPIPTKEVLINEKLIQNPGY
jgi:starch-binding outer membrane protein, SusD/RagB family